MNDIDWTQTWETFSWQWRTSRRAVLLWSPFGTLLGLILGIGATVVSGVITLFVIGLVVVLFRLDDHAVRGKISHSDTARGNMASADKSNGCHAAQPYQ